MKSTMKLATMALAVSISSVVFAQAYDTASDPVYVAGQEYIQVGTTLGDQTAATNGLNGGYGWNRWQRGGYGDNNNFGSTKITNLSSSFNMGAQQFGLRSGVGGLDYSGADARRRLLNPLNVGNTMSFSLMAGGGGAGDINTVGEFGAEIRSSQLSNPGRDMCSIIGEMGRNWRVYRDGGTMESTIPVTAGQRVDVTLSVLAGDMFDITFTAFGGASSTVSGKFLSTGQHVQTVQFYCYGTDGDYYVNNLAAVPEPSSLLVLGALGAIVARRRKSN
ncbi:MAG: PEP-CTERM sorting domain-containing protein [Armatimonadetes bacterium]|nr:PEP-CTERM sorting domain-containing protein [Armatimonadota bacterium]